MDCFVASLLAMTATTDSIFKQPAVPRHSVQRTPPPPIGSALRIAMQMSLYRFYAFVGRRKLGWDLRRRAFNILRKLSGSD